MQNGLNQEPILRNGQKQYFRFETAGEVFNFAVAHEAIHLGLISGLGKVIAASSSHVEV
ncbi:hypothetical protein NQ117_01590 [Paenibacillus sp. SC116]|nr:hypothetical protein [Paenibacillus sp. SC116]